MAGRGGGIGCWCVGVVVESLQERRRERRGVLLGRGRYVDVFKL